MENNQFLNNFRALPTLQQRDSSSQLTQPGTQPTLNMVKGEQPENYGTQQNAIGMGALTLLSGLISGGVFPLLLAGAVTFKNKKDSEPSGESFTPKDIIVDPRRLNENLQKLIEENRIKTPIPNVKTPIELRRQK